MLCKLRQKNSVYISTDNLVAMPSNVIAAVSF